MTTNWRLIETPPANGPWNMAVDEAILEATVRGAAQPTLRLYAWTPPCLSLGYAQPAADVDWQAVQQRGWQVVRRPTGGRAILHADELTYSVAGPDTDPHLSGGVLESYRRLAGALLDGLRRLQLQVEAKEQANAPGLNTNPVCFETPSNYEITVQGKKLVGSAQSRRLGGVLQHGSLPLHGDLTRITQALAFPHQSGRQQAAMRLLEHAATVETTLGRIVPFQQAVQAFIDGFEHTLEIQLERQELRPAELRRAEELLAEKYTAQAWTRRV